MPIKVACEKFIRLVLFHYLFVHLVIPTLLS